MTENLKVQTEEVEINFNSINIGKSWSFDSYNDEYHYRSAERDNSMVVAKIVVESNLKDPKLPLIALYYYSNSQLFYVGTFAYEFARWEDYGSYLGNYADYGNDFAHSKKIKFNCGLEVPNTILSKPLFVVASNQNCFVRNNEKFKNPPIFYKEENCKMTNTLRVEDFENEFHLVKVFNKSKM